MGYVSLSLATENTYICFVPLSLTTRNISILPSASLHQKYVCFVSLGFVSLKGNGLRFPQPQDSKNHICFVPLSLTTENILILPSAHLHQKYAGVYSLSLSDSKFMGYVSLSLMTQKSYLLCSPQSHATKYFDPSLSQFTPKICRFRFPQPR